MDSSSSAIQIQNVWKVFGNTSKEALDAIQNKKISKTEALENYNSVIGVSDVSFDVKQGEIFCVMGLSGSGKSTLVRHINRLLEPTSGKILLDNEDVTFLRASQRDIAFVFQLFALYPHMNVKKNLAFPLKMQGFKKSEINKRIEEVSELLRIQHLLNSKVSSLYFRITLKLLKYFPKLSGEIILSYILFLYLMFLRW